MAILDGAFTVIVGPNACGKSTRARELGLLAQTAIAPDSITVADLVPRGDNPYQSLLKQWTHADCQAVPGEC